MSLLISIDAALGRVCRLCGRWRSMHYDGRQDFPNGSYDVFRCRRCGTDHLLSRNRHRLIVALAVIFALYAVSRLLW